MINDQALHRFFDAYSARMNAALSPTPTIDFEATASAFTHCFLEASPRGVNCGKNDNAFRVQIPKGFEFYRSIGTQAMNITARLIIPIDDFHAMVKIHWKADYKKQDGTELSIEFDVFYFLQMLTDEPHIFAYVTGDEQKLYQEMGIVLQQSANTAV